MASLFGEYCIKDLHLKNRIVMAPMCMFSAEDGFATDWHVVHYATRAVGGTGLIIVEASAVDPIGRITAEDLGLWSDEHIPGMKAIVDAVHREGGKIGIQLAHAGRKADIKDVVPVSCSATRFSDDYEVPQALSEDGIHHVVTAFEKAAERALAAGFDLIEIHAAHGYLINQFLSPLVNDRTDAYGGSPENRSLIFKDIIQAIRRVWPMQKPLCARVSAEEYAISGNRPTDVATLINYVKNDGLDMIHVSSGAVVSGSVETWPGYQIGFAETIHKETNLPVIGGGLVIDPTMAEAVLRDNRVDLVFIGRELLRNPYWPMSAAQRLGVSFAWQKQYERAKPYHF